MSRQRHRRRRRRVKAETIAAWAFVVAAGVGGAMAGGHSTGWVVTDRLLAGLFAALVTLSVAWARRWTWIVIAGGASLMAVSADDHLAQAMALWALVLAVGSVAVDKRDRAIGALVGGLSIEALLRIRGFGGSGASALLTAAIVAPALVSAYRRLGHNSRRHVWRGVLIAGAAAALLMVPVAIGALLAKSRIEHGISEVRAGFTAAQNGDKPSATAHFRNAEASFHSARKYVDSWWTTPARAVPLGGLQAGVLAVATHEGDSLAGVAASLAEAENVAQSVQSGTVSIDAVSKLSGPLNDAFHALDHASGQIDEVRSTFLLPQLSDRLDRFSEQVTKALPAAADAQAAIRVAPDMLGTNGPRRYLVLFTTPAEARGTGGFVGSWALLTTDHGHIALDRSGKITELNDSVDKPRALTGPERYLTAYTDSFHPEVFFQNVTASPDFPDVASVAAQLAPQTTLGAPVDGVLLIDPYTMASLLRFTGPVSVSGLPEQLTAENAAHVFLVDQYQLFTKRGSDGLPGTREDFLAEALKQTFDAFLGRQLPNAQNMVDVLGPMVEQRRLLAYSVHPDEQALFARLGMDGAFASPDAGDFLSLVTTNRGGNKLDAYLHRALHYDVTYSPSTGDVKATATVNLRNDAPPDGLPFEVGFNDDDLPVGTNQTALTVYSPFDLDGVTNNGQPFGVVSHREFGFNSYTVYLDLPPQGSAKLVFSLHGSTGAHGAYRLRILPQPLANPDEVDVRLTADGGWRPRRGPGVTVDGAAAKLEVDPTVASDMTVGFL